MTVHFLRKDAAVYRCKKCAQDAVTKRRRKVKTILVEEAGGACIVCGYDRYAGALDFHHLNPDEKSFGLGHRGLTLAIARLREETAKCVLLCSNCHREVEAGITKLPGGEKGVQSPLA